MVGLEEIDRLLAETESELARLAARRTELQQERAAIIQAQKPLPLSATSPSVTNHSPEEEKIALFRNLFRGRDDVYPRRFESQTTGKTGYQPACRNEWVTGICEKPRVRCFSCVHRKFLTVTDRVVRNHLLGLDPGGRSDRDFTIGVYPMLADETCWFLAVDFDRNSWHDDAQAFLESCRLFDIPAALERSRSGNGGHVWIFFSEPVPARVARNMGAYLVTQTMERRPEVGLESYDRLFPSQDTLPKGGFGNLIALPLQKKPRANENSVFLDENLVPYHDQWVFLSSLRRMTRLEVESLVGMATEEGELLGIRMPVAEEGEDTPWLAPPSRQGKEPPIVGPFPTDIEVVLGNQIYVPKDDLTSSLRNRLIRLAAFQNPEFYQAQAMRLSTFGKPRIISCCEDFPKHLGLPRGCLDDALALFQTIDINVKISDERLTGTPIHHQFQGNLREQQRQAADALLRHDIGVLSASTAFGKTVVSAYLIAQRRTNTLVVVHRRQLLEQWMGALSEFLDLSPDEIGQIGGGKRKPTGKIDVAMVQSLVRRGIVKDLVGDYGHVIVDECHHISAVSFEQVVRQCKAKYLTGLSATMTRKDGHHPIIFMQCGPVRFRVDDRTQAAQRPFDHKVIVRPTESRLPPHLQNATSVPIQNLYSALVTDCARNRLIVDDVIAAVHAKRFPVLLTERREHLDLLADMIAQEIDYVFVLKGGMRKKQRAQLMEEIASLPADQPRVILATGRYLGEGFDDERLDTLFLALPISWRGTLTQYAGRLHRLNKEKEDVIIYDYVDFEIPVLERMHTKRRSGYRSIGYEVVSETSKRQAGQLVLEGSS